MELERRRQLQKVTQLEQLVKAAVNAADPIGLLGMDAPEDEYDGEVELILGALIRLGPRSSELAGTIMQVFDRKFWSGSVSTIEAQQIALRICEGWTGICDE